jgi:NADH-quinone oxidoreductase subunit N
MNSLGFAFITFSFAILYGISGSTLIENIVNSLEANSFNASLFILSLVMACAGFFLKLGIFPFHSWVPDVYEGTPLNIAMFVSSGVKVAIFTAFLRLFIPVFGISPIWIKVFLVFSVISIIAGSLMMLGQDNIRRLLGFSDIVHSGTILSVLVVIPSLAIFSTVFYLIAYAFTMISSFALVGIVGEEFNMWRGIFKEIPLLGGSGIVAFMSLAGLPPFAGFWAKFFVLLSLIHNNFFFMALLVVFSSLLALYGYLKPIAESYKENKSLSLKQVNFWKFLVLSVSVLAIVVLGVFPELITGKITEAVISFLSQNG